MVDILIVRRTAPHDIPAASSAHGDGLARGRQNTIEHDSFVIGIQRDDVALLGPDDQRALSVRQ